MSARHPDYSLKDFAFLPLEAERKDKRPAQSPFCSATSDSGEVIYRFEKYLDATPGAVHGQHGDQHTFVMACRGVVDFALSDKEVFDALWQWNLQKCDPLWSASELEQKIRNARRYFGDFRK